jgi:hypothetical protein
MSPTPPKLPIFFLQDIPIPNEQPTDIFLGFPLTPLRTWRDQNIPFQVSFLLLLSVTDLFFGIRASRPPTFDRSVKPGSFHEGLWEKDVAEIFICEDEGTRYQEFNLAPSGAWWTQPFSHYRIRESGYLPPKTIKTFTSISEIGWEGLLIVPRASLSVACTFSETSRVNVACIIHDPDPVYLSWAYDPNRDPDYHTTGLFQSVELLRM